MEQILVSFRSLNCLKRMLCDVQVGGHVFIVNAFHGYPLVILIISCLGVTLGKIPNNIVLNFNLDLLENDLVSRFI